MFVVDGPPGERSEELTTEGTDLNARELVVVVHVRSDDGQDLGQVCDWRFLAVAYHDRRWKKEGRRVE